MKFQEPSTDIQEVCSEVTVDSDIDAGSFGGDSSHKTDTVSTNNVISRTSSTSQEERFLQFQTQDIPNLLMPVHRRRRSQPANKDTENDSESPSNGSNNTESSLILHKDSELAVTINRMTTASRAGLDLASIITGIALETAKLSTRAGLGFAKTVTGVISDRLVQTMSRDGKCGLIDTSTNLLHHTLNITEQVALVSLEFATDTAQFAFGTTNESMTIIDTLFGTTDAAKALAEFVQLVKREFNVSYEQDDNLEDNLGTFGAFRVIKALTAWACLQYVTNSRMENGKTGWKRVRLVDLSDMYDWVHVSKSETEDMKENIYDELEYLLLEDEGDEEMVIISNKSNNIVIGELTPKEEIPGFRFSMSDEKSKRLSDIYLDATKRLSNPYLEEYEFQTEDEKLFSLLHNLKRYSKFGSSAYDFKTAIIDKIPFPRFPIKSQRWKERGRLHRFSFASNTDLPFDSIVDSSHTKTPKNPSNYQPSYFIIRDHTTESIILALRGTMSIHDLIVDLTCEYEEYQLPEDVQRGIDTKHKVHKGMFQVAKSLAEPGNTGVFEVLKRELEANEGYGLVLVGHSLGAGVASLLALLLASPTTRQTTVWSRLPRGRRVHAYAFATPCVMSAELSKRVRPLVTSVAYGNDVVCRLSLGHVRDLRNMVRFLGSNKQKGGEEGQETASKIIRKVLDYQSRAFFANTEEGRKDKEDFENFFWKARQDVYKHMQSEKLYPPGTVYWIIGNDRKPYCDASYDDEEGSNKEKASDVKGNGIEKELGERDVNNDDDIFEEKGNITTSSGKQYIMLEIDDVSKIFEEIWFSSHMMFDHLPHMYDDEFKERLKRLLHNFQAPIRYVIAYGSGVFPQQGYDYDHKKDKPMIDFLFAVGHPQHWHSLNINQNRKHYSFMATLGSGAITMLQENFGAGIYYNPYVKIDDTLIKYGVVSIDKMCKDLLNWETLYLAGRMHKPVKILSDDARVRLAQQVNLASALRTALLLLPKDFTEEELYLTISSISFKGDFRKYFGENPNKIKNVVSRQMKNFNLLYGGLIQGLPNVDFVANGKLQQDDSPKARAQMIQKLPRTLKYKVQEEHRMVLAGKGIQWPSGEILN
ncbi:12863_t:CDS:2 [Funneliformis geosporum]|uniref:Phosphatidate cytidylyltransferase, mitochondrial n=1 Tax=Funneliformis geosporum TaxID=1117311 RepID=A0A9W4WVM8_9GLOM|nr:12863_t:CDS:2 [Funneliformis geosporum]CAI2167008.1 17803_t:CDS:2 [Funneliformis geosporum]